MKKKHILKLSFSLILLNSGIKAKPMEPSTASRIRQVSRVCRKRRAELVKSGEIVDEAEWRMLNVIIVIVGDYFDQKDLRD